MKRHMTCCDTTTKILLMIFNCIFWAFGIAILGVGIWIKTDPELSNLGQAIKVGDQEPVVEIVTWLFIGAGIFVFAVGVVGIIGIIRESKIMMGFYICCVFIVFSAEVGAGVYAAIKKDQIIELIKDEGAQFINSSYDRDSLVSKGFNYVQVRYKCCGVKDFTDYRSSTYLTGLGTRIKANASMSWACCKTTTALDDAFKGDGKVTVGAEAREICMTESVKANLAYGDGNSRAIKEAHSLCKSFDEFNCELGCVDALVEWTEDNIVVMLAVGIAIGACQLILLFLALWFCQSLGKEEK